MSTVANSTKFYDRNGRRLVYVREAATPEFWDSQWLDSFDPKEYERVPKRALTVQMTQKYLPAGSVVLEGGCGLARTSWWLKSVGYQAIAIDFAERTIDLLKEKLPDLDSRVGDLRHLDVEDASIDGFWSLGVIEHDWDGYAALRDEMARVIRPGGFLFLTFPYMSPLRRLKGRARLYPAAPERCPDGFYQFALDGRAVARDFEQHGFEVVERHPFLPVRGLEDELRAGSGLIKPLLSTRVVRTAASRALRRLTSHCILLVLRRR
ncbi:MAG: class I SAM-dependent methyltransferase [Myxococcota bacterium]